MLCVGGGGSLCDDPFIPVSEPACNHHLSKVGRAPSLTRICHILVSSKTTKDGLICTALLHVHTSKSGLVLFPPALPPPSAEPHQQKTVFEISTGQEYGKDSIWSLNGLIPPDTCSGGQLPIVTTTQHELGSVGTQRKNHLPGLSGATFFLSVRYPERRWSGNSHIHDTDPKNR